MLGRFFKQLKLDAQGILLKTETIQKALIFLIDLRGKKYCPYHIPQSMKVSIGK